jgi:hypothetical protein
MLTRWKINRYRQKLTREMQRRNNGGLLQSAFDRHWVNDTIADAIRSHQSPAALATQLSKLADQRRQEQDVNFHRRMEQLTARARA